MKLIVITDSKALKGETDIANRLFENGLRRLHIRKPDFTVHELRQYIGSIREEYHQYLVLQSHFDLFQEFTLGGIHLSSHAREEASTWKQIKDIPADAISTSFHSWQEIIDNNFPYGYVFVSPVFNSISKPGYEGSIDLGGAAIVQKELAYLRQPVPSIIGLGGITTQNLAILHRYGFDGAAILGHIWLAADPVAALKDAADAIRLIEDGLYRSEG